MLWQIGVRADVRVIYEHRNYQSAAPADIAWRLLPAYASPEQAERFTTGLEPLLSRNGDGYSYHYTIPVGIVTWTRPDRPVATNQ
jgi:hypothetical protein